MRPKTATSSESSLVTLRSFQPRLRIGPPGDELFPIHRARPEDPGVRHPVPRFRIWSVSVCIGLGLSPYGTTGRRCPKAMSPLEIAGGAKRQTGGGACFPRSPVYPGRPVGRVLFPGAKRRGMVIWDGCHQPPRAAYPRLAGSCDPAGRCQVTPRRLFGLARLGLPCHRCCQRCGGLLPHRFTLLPFPRACARVPGRSVLWPCPRLAAPRPPGSLPVGARTFLGLNRKLQP